MRKGRRLPLEALQPFLLSWPSPPAQLNWTLVFGNANPVELEVGFGKGTFLVEASQVQPGINFVGIEIDRGLQLYVANRVAKRSLNNVRLGHGDAGLILREYVAPGSLQAVHVYFPDPWWKQRHRKRRVFTPAFAAACSRVLQPGGRLHIATDVEEYFQVMLAAVAEQPTLQPTAEFTAESLVPGAVTNFQRKAIEQGRAVWRAVFVRT